MTVPSTKQGEGSEVVLDDDTKPRSLFNRPFKGTQRERLSTGNRDCHPPHQKKKGETELYGCIVALIKKRGGEDYVRTF